MGPTLREHGSLSPSLTTRLSLPDAHCKLFLSWTSFFNCMALSRSLSNSTETSLTAVALRFWLRYLESIERALQAGKTTTDTGALASALAWAAVACILRPTNAVLWIVLLLHLMFTARRRPAIIGRTLVWCLWLASVILLLFPSLADSYSATLPSALSSGLTLRSSTDRRSRP